MKETVLIPILTKEYYNVPNMYRFMTKVIFDSLEAAFLEGSATALVPEDDYYKMTQQIIACHGIENN